ncbi:MAG TPA: AraC family transcriptional regulator [Saprospiraceae bacterium]|nr:AraC family transcriptional regulator [Saprospiraceae bacterium]
MLLSDKFYSGRKLQTLVENQTSYTLNNAAMHIFETHQTADRILLQFDQPVLASMLQGKKIMHLRSKQAFDFLPGESLILPSDEVMCIDFPEANMDSPTKCMAMAISEDKIREVIMIMNETMPRSENQEWCFMDYNFHFTNDTGIYHILQRLLFLFTENHPAKDLFVDFMLKELIIRIMQAESKKIYTDQALHMNTSNRLAYVVNYIRKNLQQNLNVQDLSQKAYMSESNFHKVFKNELGISPVEFINNERIKLASSLLQDPNIKIKEVYMECGFESRSYFNRLFKRKKNISPKEFKDSVQN